MKSTIYCFFCLPKLIIEKYYIYPHIKLDGVYLVVQYHHLNKITINLVYLWRFAKLSFYIDCFSILLFLSAEAATRFGQ